MSTEDQDQLVDEEKNHSIPSSRSSKTSELTVARWSDFRMWRRPMCAVANGGSSATWLAEWKPTDVMFRARNQAEAQKKANKLWRESQWGSGSMLCVPADEDLRLSLAKTQDTNTSVADGTT